MKDILNNCFNSQTVASFYCDTENCKSHYTGYIHAYNDSEIIIAHISPYGFYDGYVIRQIDDIYKIEFDTEYEKKIEKLYRLRAQSHKNICGNSALLLESLDFAKQNEFIVTFYLENECISGFINDVNDENISLKNVNDNGIVGKEANIKIDDILLAEIDTEYEQSLLLLVNNL